MNSEGAPGGAGVLLSDEAPHKDVYTSSSSSSSSCKTTASHHYHHHHHHDDAASQIQLVSSDAVNGQEEEEEVPPERFDFQYVFYHRLKHSLKRQHEDWSDSGASGSFTMLNTIADCEAWVKNGGTVGIVGAGSVGGAVIDINGYDSHGFTQLHYAVKRGKLNVLKWLLANDGDINKPTKKTGSLPLHLCIESNGDMKMMQFLISRGANINKQDFKGRTPLHWAAKYGRILSLVYLLKLPEINLRLVDNRGRSVCHFAVLNKDVETAFGILKYLLDYKADILLPDHSGDTPLHYACQMNNPLFYLLIAKSLSIVNSRNNNGKSPKDLCINNDHLNLILNMEKEHRYLPSGMLQYRFQLSTCLWTSLLFFSFTFLPIYLSTLVILWIFILTKQHNSMVHYSKIFCTFWQLANVIIILTMLCFVIPCTTHWFLTILYVLAHSFCLISNYKCSMTSPGHIASHSSAIIEIHNAIITKAGATALTNNYCLSCLVKKESRSKHCRTCDKCVLKFDHHCIWIDTCIGNYNLKYFYYYVFYLFCSLIIGFILLYQYLYSSSKTDHDIYSVIINSYYHHSWVLSVLLLFTLSFPGISYLFIMMIIMLFYGVTSNEWFNRKRYDYLKNQNGKFFNPYSKGFIGNLKEVMNPTSPSVFPEVV